jgi:hypothetical protein
MPKRDPILAALGLNVRQRREARELTQVWSDSRRASLVLDHNRCSVSQQFCRAAHEH